MTATVDRAFARRPESYQRWVESLPDDVSFCDCPGVTWVNRDPRTSRPCRTCGGLRHDDMCVVATKKPHVRRACRSVDSAHLDHLIWMAESAQLRAFSR